MQPIWLLETTRHYSCASLIRKRSQVRVLDRPLPGNPCKARVSREAGSPSTRTVRAGNGATMGPRAPGKARKALQRGGFAGERPPARRAPRGREDRPHGPSGRGRAARAAAYRPRGPALHVVADADRRRPGARPSACQPRAGVWRRAGGPAVASGISPPFDRTLASARRRSAGAASSTAPGNGPTNRPTRSKPTPPNGSSGDLEEPLGLRLTSQLTRSANCSDRSTHGI